MNNELLLTRACWPVFLTLINTARQVRRKDQPDPKATQQRLKSALREGGELAARDPAASRVWSDRIRRFLIYFIDDKMVHLHDWNGRAWWLQNRLETDVDGLDERRSEGGDRFYEECDALQRDYEEAERRGREDRAILAEQLGICFTCLRLGFRGAKRDRPEDHREYARRLYGLLPGQRTLTEEQLFPEAYKHTQNKTPLYPVGMSWAVVGGVLSMLLLVTIVTYYIAWSVAMKEIREIADQFRNAQAPAMVQPATAPAAG